MQSIFRLTWCSDQLGSKMATSQPPSVVRPSTRDLAAVSPLKRKLSDAHDLTSITASANTKKPRADSARSLTPPAPAYRTDATCDASSDASVAVAPEALSQAIENTFNMSILAKHNELRLIEQELAKCQIALEQLRRCELRPYPGALSPSIAVTDGVGQAVAPPPGFSHPPHPAPYGVTDGPYARHYRQWLLQDSYFDPMSPLALATQAENASAAGRSTRNSGSARKSIPKAVGCSTRSESLQSIPNYPSAPPKDKSAPLVLRRSTDGQMVKLICNNCHRGNFSSIQGFLNHCRIAHKVDYKSHDMAAIDCGRPLDENEMAALPNDSSAATAPVTPLSAAPRPIPSRTASVVAPVTTAVPNNRNLVHPFNTSHATSFPTPAPSIKRAAAAPVPCIALPTPKLTPQVPFKASTQAPHLSSYFAKHQLGGDLAQAYANAKQKIDLDMGCDEESMYPDTPDSMSVPATPLAGARTVMSGAQSMPAAFQPPPHRPASRKSHTAASSSISNPDSVRPRPAPVTVNASTSHTLTPPESSCVSATTPTESHHQPPSLSHSPSSSSALSPHTLAADSNPGLVSDHEEDDLRDGYGSVSDEDAPMHHSTSPRSRHARAHGPVLHRGIIPAHHHQHHSIPMVDMVASAPGNVRSCGDANPDPTVPHDGVRVHADEGVHLDVDVHDDDHGLVRPRFLMRRSSLVARDSCKSTNANASNPAWRK